MNENLNNEMGVVDRTDYEPERTAAKKERSPLMSWGLLLVLPLTGLVALGVLMLWSQGCTGCCDAVGDRGATMRPW